MPHEPKKRHSRQRQGKRRASISLAIPRVTSCTNCSAKIPFHTICPECGYYKGIQVRAAKEVRKSAETA